MRRFTKAFTILVIALIFTSGAFAQRIPKNIILLIGDGMGIGIISAARYVVDGNKLAMDSCPYTGFSITNPLGCLVTDSAASGTAMSTGRKTTNGRIGSTPYKENVPTILELAHKQGKMTGVVSTKNITDATPAAFMAHTETRQNLHIIAEQMIHSGADVILGGGWDHFIPKSKEDGDVVETVMYDAQGKPTVLVGSRSDNRNIIEEAKSEGFTFVNTREAMLADNSTKLLGLFNPGIMDTFSGKEPTLAQMTMKAIDIISKGEDGFFLMSEAGIIDNYLHANDLNKALHEMLEFNDAIAAVLDFAKNDGNTLVVITADHDTGCLGVVDPAKEDALNGKIVGGVFATGGHTANMVPIFAYGPGAEKFTGVIRNIQIPHTFADFWGINLAR